MFHLACTRFTNSTYRENIDYREKNNEPLIYGTTLQIRKIYSVGALIFVFEMNNDTNQIEGIGLIKNSLICDKRYKIYENNEYNRYIYSGKYWLSRKQIIDIDSEIVEIFDTILFKGKSHLKRRTGITIITEKLFVHWAYDLKTLKNRVKKMFLDYFKFKTLETPVINNIVKIAVEDVINSIIDKFNNNNNNNDNDNDNSNDNDIDIEFISIIPKKRKRTKVSKY